MKKFLILAVATLAASAACTKVENTPAAQKEISFQVAKYVPQTKAAGDKVVYATTNTFGTYAWATGSNATGTSDASDHAAFMINETVGFVSPVWKTTVHTFYWPKTGTMDFISYSPFNGTNATADSNPAITQNTIAYTEITAASTDYMYADKVTCTNPTANTQAGNLTIEKNDDDERTAYTGSQYEGVPTLFRHALAKVSFKIKANFLEWGTAGTDYTKWKLTVQEFKIGGLYTKGDKTLTLKADNKSWETGDPAIWTNLSEKTTAQNLADTPIVLDPDDASYPGKTAYADNSNQANYKDLTALTNPFVMPQELVYGDQQLHLKVKIETTNAGGNTLTEYFEKDFNLRAISDLNYWEMNKNYVYLVLIKPTANVSTPNNPTDVTINFDPAISDWETVTSSITIQL